PGVSTDILGDVIICAPVVEREARDLCVEPPAHWAHLVVHGVLHLCGFDHERETEARRMEALEAKVLGDFGFTNPYER
ncbi:MAG: rRNA maturation RNase YbeY, partial [Gammaproteobacteria bacterium]|nr:rRNA maturation RNase YbeY [Gammaproteobacteria bacterium]